MFVSGKKEKCVIKKSCHFVASFLIFVHYTPLKSVCQYLFEKKFKKSFELEFRINLSRKILLRALRKERDR